MKNILITGANSYIGTSFEKYIRENYPNDYAVDTVDMINGSWREKNFSGYDTVFHVAGLAHQKETKENAYMYYAVNRDLAIQTAQKAQRDGVPLFIFLSSMSIYGKNSGVITKETIPQPLSHYGKSKMEAEKMIMQLQSEKFHVAILRPPMVYGKNCKGNFQTIVKIVEKTPVFPQVDNRRSMIYIDNLSSFVEMCVKENLNGVFFPQNQEYMNTSYLAREVALEKNKRIFLSRALGLAAKLTAQIISPAAKAFGSLVYENTEDFDFCYCKGAVAESIRKSV